MKVPFRQQSVTRDEACGTSAGISSQYRTRRICCPPVRPGNTRCRQRSRQRRKCSSSRRSLHRTKPCSPCRAGRPVLAMDGSDAARVGANPRYRVGAGFEAGADIELQHDRRLRILRQYFNRSLALDRSELTLVVVIPGLQSRWFKLIGGGVQRVGDFFPSVQTRLWDPNST